MLKRISMLLIAVSIIACSKKEKLNYSKSTVNGVEIITNENRPADSSFKLELKELLTISGDSEDSTQSWMSISSSGIDFDSQDNIYMLDGKNSTIHKYDKTGKHLKTFGREGQGPGEFRLASAIVVINDTILVGEWLRNQMIKFSTDGAYCGVIKGTANLKMPAFPSRYGDNLLSNSTNTSNNGKEVVYSKKVEVWDKYFKPIKDLTEIVPDYDQSVYDLNLHVQRPAAIDSTKIYLAEQSTDRYQIDILDLSGKKIGEIRKKYIRQPFSAKELADLTEMLKQNNMKVKGTIKNSIEYMITDKFGRLYVLPAQKSDLKLKEYDLFDKGVFINRVTLQTDSLAYSAFIDDKLVQINPEKREIKFYDYK